MMNEASLLYALSGLGVGALVGPTGVGGGSLMTPLLVLVVGSHPDTAVGTNLLYAAINKSMGTLFHGFNRTVDWRLTGLLGAGSLPVAELTVIGFVGPTRDDPQMAALVRTKLGLSLLLTAAKLVLRRPLLAAMERLRQGRNASLRPRSHDALTVAVGATLGFLVSVTSVGAGAPGMTALFALYPCMATHRLVASGVAHAVPLTFIGEEGYWYLEGVDFPMLRSILLASIPGILIGSLLSPRMPCHVLRPILAAVLATVGPRLAWA